MTIENIALVESDVLPDWWTIEHAEHDNKHWMEETGPSTSSLRYSGRISDACVEGTSAEMLCIAEAIENRSVYSAKRCAVDATGDFALFESPRNSRVAGEVSMEGADALAADIRKRVKC